jgi:hypothetical protein
VRLHSRAVLREDLVYKRGGIVQKLCRDVHVWQPGEPVAGVASSQDTGSKLNIICSKRRTCGHFQVNLVTWGPASRRHYAVQSSVRTGEEGDGGGGG